MDRLPYASISLRIPQDLLIKVRHLVETGLCRDNSSAIRSLIEGGLLLHDYKNSIQDPDIVRKLGEEWESKMNEKEIFGWAKNLKDQQITAVKMVLEMEEDSRRR